jgi:hypothetical protein
MNLFERLKVPTFLADGFTVSVLTVILVILLLALTYFALRGRGLWYRLGALALFVAAVPTIVLAVNEQLSYGRPLSIEYLETLQESENGLLVYGVKIYAPKTISLWADINGEDRLFSIPWSEPVEKSLEGATNALAAAGGGELRLRKGRTDPSLADDEQAPLEFYPEPWQEAPSKDAPPPQPKVFVPNAVA